MDTSQFQSIFHTTIYFLLYSPHNQNIKLLWILLLTYTFYYIQLYYIHSLNSILYTTFFIIQFVHFILIQITFSIIIPFYHYAFVLYYIHTDPNTLSMACSVTTYIWRHNLNSAMNFSITTTSPFPTICLEWTLMILTKILIQLIWMTMMKNSQTETRKSRCKRKAKKVAKCWKHFKLHLAWRIVNRV